MLFTSAIFLFLFLPIVLLAYFSIPNKFKNFFLLLSSLFFYTWGEFSIVLVMVASTVIDFFAGILIEKRYRKTGLLLSISANLSFLGFFKYANFAFENYNAILNYAGLSEYFLNLPNIALPIGISFYTFQTMSYTIDVYRGNIKANRNFIDFATYVTMFPQLIAGPIVRYKDIYKQLKNRNHSINKFTTGIERFIIGMAKKMIIANSFAEIADDVFALHTANIDAPIVWIGIIAYSFQIYFDFSAYSDMAIGLGKMFGFDIQENFNYPYISKSIKEFWRRWHISLSTWFRDYLYISLGGNRVSSFRLYLNLFIVFFITGLWHGASWNFVVWGLFHGFFLVLERIWLGNILNKIWKPLRHFYTLFVVLISWVFFRADSISQSFDYLKTMFGFCDSDTLFDYRMFLQNKHILILLIGIIFSMPVFLRIKDTIDKRNFNEITLMILKILYYVLLIVLFIISISMIASGSYNPFIYFRF
jgi:alginate O-acetyltransferase complex protein AlgI